MQLLFVPPIIEKKSWFVFVIFLTLSTLRKISQWEHTLINSVDTKLKQLHYHNRIHLLWPSYTALSIAGDARPLKVIRKQEFKSPRESTAHLITHANLHKSKFRHNASDTHASELDAKGRGAFKVGNGYRQKLTLITMFGMFSRGHVKKIKK